MKWIAVSSSVALSLALAIAPARAGTNFPAVQDYPPPNCAKPGPVPVLQSDNGASRRGFNTLIDNRTSDDDAVTKYNEKLARYNAAQLAYHACINAYIANAQLDLNMIRSKSSKPVPNFPALKDYPPPDCGDPAGVPMVEGGSMDSLSQRTSNYNAAMARYNKYIACMNAYMANVQADTNVIQARVNSAVTDGNP
jgi:hypothetical protein